VAKPNKVSVSWAIKWPFEPVNYAMLNPTVTIDATIEEGETYEAALNDTHHLAIQSAIECLIDGIDRMKEELDEEDCRL